MKKALLLAVVLIMGYSANCFAAAAALCSQAADGTYSIGTTANHQLTGVKPSANVRLSYGSTTQTVGGVVTGIAYTLGTYHSSGTFTYATSSGDTNIYRFPKNESTNAFSLPPDAPTTATAGATWTGWTASK
jgi:hypothetical protein